MGRPAASPDNRRLAIMFASACTYPTESSKDLIARSGNFSIFTALQRCCPSSVRVALDSPRDGISEHEFNKLMQAEGFIRVRDRRAVATKKDSDPDGAGLYLFSNRRWRDPDNMQDFKILEQAWQGMMQFGIFQKECSLRSFLEIVASFKGSWKPRAGRMRRRPIPKGQPGSGASPQVCLSSAFSSTQSLASTEVASSSSSSTPSPRASVVPAMGNPLLASLVRQPVNNFPQMSTENTNVQLQGLVKGEEMAKQEKLIAALASQVQLEQTLQTALLLQQAQIGLGMVPNLNNGLNMPACTQLPLAQLALQQQLLQKPAMMSENNMGNTKEFQDGALALAMLSKGDVTVSQAIHA